MKNQQRPALDRGRLFPALLLICAMLPSFGGAEPQVPRLGEENLPKEEDRWVKDARAEWPAATGTLQKMAGKNAVVLQIGGLRSDYNSGSLILICDGRDWSFGSLRLFCLSEAWGEYEAFRLTAITEKEQVRLMTVIREIVETMEKDLPQEDEDTQWVGGVESSGGCLVMELACAGKFRQYGTNQYNLRRSAQVKSAMGVLSWWFRSNVSLMVGDKIIPAWNGQEVPRLPVEALFPKVKSPAK